MIKRGSVPLLLLDEQAKQAVSDGTKIATKYTTLNIVKKYSLIFCASEGLGNGNDLECYGMELD